MVQVSPNLLGYPAPNCVPSDEKLVHDGNVADLLDEANDVFPVAPKREEGNLAGDKHESGYKKGSVDRNTAPSN